MIINKLLKMFILITIVTAIIGLMFWPENLGKAHKIMYNGYMAGWSKI